jgi:hypothetical protein
MDGNSHFFYGSFPRVMEVMGNEEGPTLPNSDNQLTRATVMVIWARIAMSRFCNLRYRIYDRLRWGWWR